MKSGGVEQKNESFTPIADEALVPMGEASAPMETVNVKLTGTVTAWQRKDGEDYFCIDLPPNPREKLGYVQLDTDALVRAEVDGVAARALSSGPLYPENPSTSMLGALVNGSSAPRNRKVPAPKPLPCKIMVRTKKLDGKAMIVRRVSVDLARESTIRREEISVAIERKSSPRVADQWKTTWMQQFANFSDDFATFARQRLVSPGRAPMAATEYQLRELLEWLTPVDAVNDALEANRQMFASTKETPSVSLDTLKLPDIESHPWKKMTEALAVSKPATEPLAEHVPADFYYVRFSSLPKLLDTFEWIERDWMPSLYSDRAFFADRPTLSRNLSTRYHTELGLRTGPLTKLLGEAVVQDVALVGSDPYVVEGTDVSIVFRVKNKAGFEIALQESANSYASANGGIETKTASDGAALVRSNNGRVHSYRGWAKEGVYVVSNNQKAFSKIASASRGGSATLANEPDFQYTMARDTATKAADSNVFAFMGEAFVRAATGPKQKIAELRRAIALMELRAPGYAELLFRRYFEQAPANIKEMRDAKMLLDSDLEHHDGGKITYEIGKPTSSAWGTLESPLPLIDLPEVKLLTKTEAAAYARFAEAYHRSYAAFIDPISTRADIELGGSAPHMAYDVRILPPSHERKEREESSWAREFGLSRIHMKRQEGGLHMAVGIGKGSRLRRELEDFGSNAPLVGTMHLDWIGGVAQAGLFETNQVANVLAHEKERDGFGFIEQLAKLPFYIAVEVTSPLALSAMIAKLKSEIAGKGEEIEWSSALSHRGASIVRVRDKADGPNGFLQAFYTIHKKQFVIATREDVIKRVIEMIDAGTFSTTASDTPLGEGSTNLGFQVSLPTGGGFAEALRRGSAFENRRRFATGMASTSVERSAAILFEAFPETQSDPSKFESEARRIFGGVPKPHAKGAHFTYGPEGLGDSISGAAFDPKHLARSASGHDALAAFLSTIARFETEIAFDPEPKAGKEDVRSLHFKGRVDLH